MNAFKDFIEKFSSLTDEDWVIIRDTFEKKEVKRNEKLVSEGEICRYFYFLESGLFRFFINIDGDDVTKFFTAAPNCLTEKSSFRTQTPSLENIQALENSIVWQISYEQSNKLLELKSWNTFVRKFVNHVQELTEELMMEIKTQTAEQRYFSLMNKYPELIHKIPLKHLSSFLGIAPQSLSRIRKKLHINRKS